MKNLVISLQVYVLPHLTAVVKWNFSVKNLYVMYMVKHALTITINTMRVIGIDWNINKLSTVSNFI